MRIRKAILGAALAMSAALIPGHVQAAGITVNYTFQSNVACYTTCPYWDQLASSDQQRFNESCVQPTALASNLQGLDVYDKYVDVPASIGGAAPKLMTWSVTPQIDYDLVVCVNGAAQAIVWSANMATDTCATGVPVAGCTETVRLALNATTPCPAGSVCVKSGDRILLRHWNWADPTMSESGQIVWT